MYNKRLSVALLLVMALASSVLSSNVALAQTTSKTVSKNTGNNSSKSISPVAPGAEYVKQVVSEAYEKYKADARGKNADYIPYLAHVDSNLFGIAVVTTDT